MFQFVKLYVLILTLFFAETVFAQNEQYSVEHYSINEGLSQNSANKIFQDKFGYIWVATQDGLNRFDGYEFVSYKQDPNNEKSISSNYITDICGSKDTALWLVTNEGIEKYNYLTNEFVTVIKNKHYTQSVYSTNIKAVHESETGILWLRTVNGIIKYTPKDEEFLEFRQENENDDHISDYNFFTISEDKNHDFWTGSSNGMVRFNSRNKQFERFKFDKQDINNEVFCVFLENDSIIWVGGKTGVFVFNSKTNQFKSIKSSVRISEVRSIYKDKQNVVWIGTKYGLMYLKNDESKIIPFHLENYLTTEAEIGNISNILEDKSGILWISSDYGIFKIDSKKKDFNLYRKDKNNNIQFSSNSIYSIYCNPKSKLLWLGTRGFGLNIFDRKTNSVKVFNKNNSPLPDDNIHCIVPDKKGNIWIGTNNGAVIFNIAKNSFITFSDYINKNVDKFFINNRISSILFDGNKIWFSTLNGLLLYENRIITAFKKDGTINSIVANDVFKTVKRRNGEIWVATLYGLSKFEPQTKTFKNYTKDHRTISDNSVLTLFESSDQTLWIGTGTGLNKYIQEKDSFKYYTSQSHGFSNDFIYTITEDKDKNLWLSTNKGILKFNPKTEQVINYAEEDNLQGFEYNIGAVYVNDALDEIFWGGLNGLNSINITSLKKNNYAPQPIITKFLKTTQNGKEEILIGKENEVFLTHKECSFDIHFAVPEYTHPDKNVFKYRILEANNKWIDLGVQNSISFFQMAPGDYTFEIIGANSGNQWNNTATVLKVHISAVWWRTTPAYIFYGIIGAIFIIIAIVLYNREIRRENKILNEKQIVAKEIEKQKELLSVKNNSISESMRYASRIIDAMLPTGKFIKTLIPDSFILFMSKDIVSGDFYWVDDSFDKVFVAAVDCTGHGVPGAFMSIIGLDILRNIINEGIDTPGKILNKLNKDVSAIFRKDGLKDEMKDGMDISIIAIHKYNNSIEFAGAINQLFLIRDDNILEVKGNRFSVSPANNNIGEYTNHVIEVKDNDMIYIFSDGYVDQFGGPDEKKFKFRRFRHLLLNNYKKPVDEQKNVLKRVINSWRGQSEQVDDILVMGIRIHTHNKL